MGAIKKSGSFHGKSNTLGHGGRAAQLKAQGVPGGVIGMLARKAHAAPGEKNFHGKKKMSSMGSKDGANRDDMHDKKVHAQANRDKVNKRDGTKSIGTSGMKYKGTGTKARLNTAAEKMMFGKKC
jgi:hypothetical protein